MAMLTQQHTTHTHKRQAGGPHAVSYLAEGCLVHRFRPVVSYCHALAIELHRVSPGWEQGELFDERRKLVQGHDVVQVDVAGSKHGSQFGQPLLTTVHPSVDHKEEHKEKRSVAGMKFVNRNSLER